MYVEEDKTSSEIASSYNTYNNKILRALRFHKIPIKERGDIQKKLLSTGKKTHPTKGRKRTQQEKNKIGLSVKCKYDNSSTEEKELKAQRAKKAWDNMSEEQLKDMRKKAAVAIRKSASIGSKLEHHIMTALQIHGFQVQPHKEYEADELGKQHIDIFLPIEGIAIEVDGPTHFLPIWGEEALERTRKSDEKKNAVLISKGYKVLRIRNKKKNISNTSMNLFAKELISFIPKYAQNNMSFMILEIK